MPDDSHIRARFLVTKKSVTIYARYHEVSCVLRWERDSADLARQTRRINTLIANLGTLVSEGLEEVVIQSEMAGLDHEWAALTEPPPTEETTGE